ncbi:MAG: right-handed parallel beta-helix repeat-containing protein, partial [Polyangiaceae bacterium]
QVTLTSVALVGNSEEGAFSDGAGSSLTMTNSIARDSVMLAGNTAGNGAVAQNGGKLVLNGSALIANHESGLLLFDSGSSANVTRSIIARQLTSQNKQFGRGIVLQDGPSLTMNQSVVADNTDIAFSARGVGTNATIAQSVFRNTNAQPLDGTHGRALNVIESATTTITDCEIYDNQEVAALVSGSNASLTATTSVFASTRLDTKTGSAGRGFAAQLNATGTVSGSAIVDNFQVGASSSGAGGVLSLEGSLVDGTKAASGDFGHGAISFDGGSLSLATSTLRNNKSAGVLVDAAAATVSACRITNNAVGINVQDGTTLVQAAGVPSPPNPLEVDVSDNTVFDG